MWAISDLASMIKFDKPYDSIQYIKLDDELEVIYEVYYSQFLGWHIKDVVKEKVVDMEKRMSYCEVFEEELVDEYYKVILENDEIHTIEFREIS